MPDSPQPAPSSKSGEPAWREELGLDARSLRRLWMGLLILLVGTAAAGYVLRAPLTSIADWFVDELGLWGLFTGILLTDSWVAPPMTHEPLLLFALAGGVPFVVIWACASAASVLAGPLGYVLGSLLVRAPFVRRRLSGSSVESVMRRRGAVVVAAAAITPIPFALTTWLAGAIGIPFGTFFAACLVRIVKVALYLGLITLGWGAV
jgi:membrane protein YqaA with SNARE-associated domain